MVVLIFGWETRVAGFVFMMGLLLAGDRCADLVVGRDAGWRAVMVVGEAG